MMSALTHTFVPVAHIWLVDGVHLLMYMLHFLIISGFCEMQRQLRRTWRQDVKIRAAICINYKQVTQKKCETHF